MIRLYFACIALLLILINRKKLELDIVLAEMGLLLPTMPEMLMSHDVLSYGGGRKFPDVKRADLFTKTIHILLHTKCQDDKFMNVFQELYCNLVWFTIPFMTCTIVCLS